MTGNIFEEQPTLPISCETCGGALDMETDDQDHEATQRWRCPYCGTDHAWHAGFRIVGVTERVVKGATVRRRDDLEGQA